MKLQVLYSGVKSGLGRYRITWEPMEGSPTQTQGWGEGIRKAH